MRKRVCLFSDHHISYNPRLWKEAFFWEQEGWDVTIVVMWVSKESLERDQEILKGHNIRYEAFCNLIPGQVSAPQRFWLRLRKRISGELVKLFNIQLPWSISYAPEKLIRFLKRENFQLYSAHMECGFFAGRALAESGRPVIFDFEDWYSHDYLVPERPVRLLEELERFALHKGLLCTAASSSMSTALAEYYEAPKMPLVIYNGFRSETRFIQQKLPQPPLRLLWFSRTIGAGRGLEKLMDALVKTDRPTELHLLGETMKDYLNAVNVKAAQNSRLKVIYHNFLPHEQLHGFLQQFHIGLAIEENINSNKDLTVSNKMLQYLQAGLKVIATDTAGQKEVAGFFPHRIIIVPGSKVHEWLPAIHRLADQPEPDVVQDNVLFNQLFSLEAQQQKFREAVLPILEKDNFILHEG